MGSIHSLLEARGKQAALDAGIDRSLVEAAALYMGDEDNALSFAYAGWAQCALPLRRLPDDEPWQIISDRVQLVVEPGRRPTDDNGLEFVGVPFGAHARLILLYLQTEALKTGCREVELGNSLRDWLGRIGVSVGGRTGKLVRDQAERISRCRLTFHVRGSDKQSGLINQAIVDKALFIEEGASRQGRLSLETAKLSEGFFEQLKKNPISLDEAAIRALANNPAALDVYIWLAHRLPSLSADRLVTWKILKAQFGVGFRELYHFKSKFPATLSLALAVYRNASVAVNEDGVVMKPSRPPISSQIGRIGRIK